MKHDDPYGDDFLWPAVIIATLLIFMFLVSWQAASETLTKSAPESPWDYRSDKSHNSYGGYIPACGDLPPLVGDDC